MKKHIPNSITLANLLSGCLGIIFALNGNLIYAAYAIWIGAIFDFFDGFSARLLKVSSPIGKELDSLADMVTFGVLPSFIMMKLMLNPPIDWLVYVPLIIAVFSALRLAKFNTDTRQTTAFRGMPTPSIAFFVSGLPFWIQIDPNAFNWLWVSIASIVLGALLVIPVQMLALKFKDYSIAANWPRYFLILTGVVLLLILGPKSLPITISFYFFLSLFSSQKEAIN